MLINLLEVFRQKMNSRELSEDNNSATFQINELSKALEASGKKVYRFGFGQSPFPVPAHAVEALKQNATRKDYTDPQGLLELRQLISKHHRSILENTVQPENIVVSCGSKPLLFFTQFVLKDYELVLPKGSWVSYQPQAEAIGKTVYWANTEASSDWKLLPEELDKTISSFNEKALLILNYPGNPIGKTYSKEELEGIAKVLKKHKALVIADEIYSELTFSGKHSSLLDIYPEGTILTSGISKWAGAGGWRLGYCLVHKELGWFSKKLTAVQSECLSTTSTPVQVAAISLFEEPDKNQKYLEMARSILAPLAKRVQADLVEAGIECAPADGGFYLFLNFENFREQLASKEINTSPELCDYLLKAHGIALLPGTVFGCCPEELLVRLSYVNFDGAEALAALEGHLNSLNSLVDAVSDQFLSKYCPDTLEGIDRLCAVMRSI